MSNTNSDKPGWKFWLKVLSISFGTAGAVAFVMFVPIFTDVHNGPWQNESAAVGAIHVLSQREANYAATNPATGFTCDLSLLRQAGNADHGFDIGDMLLDGKWSGYRFEIYGCDSDEHRVVRRYRATATPVKPGATGVRAFCADESGQVFFDPDGSATGCLSTRRVLPY